MRTVRRPVTSVLATIGTSIAAAVVVLGSGPALAAAPTEAPGVGDHGQRVGATASSALERKITSKTRQTTFRLFLLYGTIENLPDGTALLQKKTCVACKWDVVRKVSTNEKGWYKTKIFSPEKGKKNIWRIMVPASDGYAKSYSRVWVTFLN